MGCDELYCVLDFRRFQVRMALGRSYGRREFEIEHRGL